MYSRSQPKSYLVNIFLLHGHLFINIIKPCDTPVIGCTNISGKETFEFKYKEYGFWRRRHSLDQSKLGDRAFA